jgi:hypothetical protein
MLILQTEQASEEFLGNRISASQLFLIADYARISFLKTSRQQQIKMKND